MNDIILVPQTLRYYYHYRNRQRYYYCELQQHDSHDAK